MAPQYILMLVAGISAALAFVTAGINFYLMATGRGGIGVKSTSTGNGAGMFAGFGVHALCIIWLGLSSLTFVGAVIWALVVKFG
jgi:apolipoprotein N-acyltransferase